MSSFEKVTRIASVDVDLATGFISVRLGSALFEDGQPVSDESWHRFGLEPGGPPTEEIIKVVSDWLQSHLKRAPITGDIAMLDTLRQTVQTPEKIKVFQDKLKERVARLEQEERNKLANDITSGKNV